MSGERDGQQAEHDLTFRRQHQHQPTIATVSSVASHNAESLVADQGRRSRLEDPAGYADGS